MQHNFDSSLLTHRVVPPETKASKNNGALYPLPKSLFEVQEEFILSQARFILNFLSEADDLYNYIKTELVDSKDILHNIIGINQSDLHQYSILSNIPCQTKDIIALPMIVRYHLDQEAHNVVLYDKQKTWGDLIKTAIYIRTVVQRQSSQDIVNSALINMQLSGKFNRNLASAKIWLLKHGIELGK